jgi:gamma-glutamyl phosphate reductase
MRGIRYPQAALSHRDEHGHDHQTDDNAAKVAFLPGLEDKRILINTGGLFAPGTQIGIGAGGPVY